MSIKLVVIRKYAEVDGPLFISFINPASLSCLKNEHFECLEFFSDGFLLTKLLNILSKNKIKRTSFDFTSIATTVFESIADNNKSLYLVGAKEIEISKFSTKIMDKYGIKDLKFRCGYFESIDDEVNRVINANPDFVVVGLGAGLQEDFLVKLKNKGYTGKAFTCGGFIRQESASMKNYYPKWVDKCNMRFLYRMFKEPHTISRYFIDYPKNIIFVTVNVLTKKIRLIVK